MMSLLPLLELAINITLSVLSQQGITPANYANLASVLEAAIAPLIASIQSNSTKTVDVLAAYGALIGILNGLKMNTSLDPAFIAKIDGWLIGAQNGSTEALQAGKGFDAKLLAQVTLIQ